MIDLLIDSGAYSAHSRGIDIQLRDYIGFLREHPEFHRYISLDVVPGSNGRRHADPNAARLSYHNHQQMKEGGLNPLPVVHRQDDIRWLERYVLDGEPYIALAPHPIHQQSEIIRWLRSCFAVIPPSSKTHGLGITTAVMLQHFPFASVDSASWIAYAK